jgi:ankyrin repeat protein
MISRIDQNNYTSIIEFSLVKDEDSGISESSRFKPRVQIVAPAIAQAVAHQLGGMLVEFKSIYSNSDYAQVESARFTLRFLTTSDITDRLPEINATIGQCNLLNALRGFKLMLDASSVSVSSTQNVAPSSSKYRGKVNKKSYIYDRFNDVAKLVVSYVDENMRSLRCKSNRKSMTYDMIGNLSSIEYHYEDFLLENLAHAAEFELKVKQYVQENPTSTAFHTSVTQHDYNQALRRACADGRYELVNLLFEYSNKFDMNLDINQQSLNGKTPLDYAIGSCNKDLINLLSRNSARTAEQICLTFCDVDYNRITQQNAENRARSMARNHASSFHQHAGQFLPGQFNSSSNTLFGRPPVNHGSGFPLPHRQTSYLGLSDFDDDDFHPIQSGHPRPPFGM